MARKIVKSKSHVEQERFMGTNISKRKASLMFRRLQPNGDIRSGGCNIEDHCLNCQASQVDTHNDLCSKEEVLWCVYWKNNELQKARNSKKTEINSKLD